MKKSLIIIAGLQFLASFFIPLDTSQAGLIGDTVTVTHKSPLQEFLVVPGVEYYYHGAGGVFEEVFSFDIDDNTIMIRFYLDQIDSTWGTSHWGYRVLFDDIDWMGLPPGTAIDDVQVIADTGDVWLIGYDSDSVELAIGGACAGWLYCNRNPSDFPVYNYIKVRLVPSFPCDSDDDCDDGQFCTGVETCLNGNCRSGTEPCSTQICDEDNDICIACVEDGDCNDDLFCNGVETCEGGLCQPGTEPCIGQICDENDDTCKSCYADAFCDDEQFCNGIETCVSGLCQPGTDPCPGQSCYESSDQCVDCLVNGDCDDGEFCNGVENCVAGSCQSGIEPCPVAACNENTDFCQSITQITDNSYGEGECQINNNGELAWVGFDGSDREIFFYDGATITQLTNNDSDDRFPQINDNGEVVWLGCEGDTGTNCFYPGDYEVFLYDGITTTQLTNNDSSEENPHINNNGEVVWSGYVGLDYEIFLYDGATTTQLTNNDYHDRFLQINNNGYVVWVGSDGSGGEIFLYDGTTTTQLTDNSYDDGRCQINDNGEVVWSGYGGYDEEIFLYDGMSTTQLTNDDYDKEYPQINNNGEVVWRAGDGSDYEVFLYDGITTTLLTINDLTGSGPQINDNGEVVWWGYDGSDYEIFLYDGMSITQLTNNAYNDSLPQINNDRWVVWVGDDGSDYEVLLYSRSSIIECIDDDSDGFGNPASSACAYMELDCDDSNSEIYPGAAEICNNGVDDNCDGLADGCDLYGPTDSTAMEIQAGVGGTVETPDGEIAIEIEPGDLGEDTTISIEETTVYQGPEVDLTIGTSPALGDAITLYDLEPDGFVFDSRVTLTIIKDVSDMYQDQRDRLNLYLYTDTDGDTIPDSFVPIPGTYCDVVEDPTDTFIATCTAEADHFSTYAMVAPLDTDYDGFPDLFPPEQDNCPLTHNSDQTDGDNDGYGEACDCKDSDPDVNPGAVDIRCNGIDEDCSGSDYCPSTCMASATASTLYANPVYGSSDLVKHLTYFLLAISAVIGIGILRGKR